jgi:hypothetical protein
MEMGIGGSIPYRPGFKGFGKRGYINKTSVINQAEIVDHAGQSPLESIGVLSFLKH